jgi:hypothetical protein
VLPREAPPRRRSRRTDPRPDAARRGSGPVADSRSVPFGRGAWSQLLRPPTPQI